MESAVLENEMEQQEGVPPQLLLVGWNEWCGLPALGIDGLKAKIDTGARTSVLDAVEIVEQWREASLWVSFAVRCDRSSGEMVWCTVPVVDQRIIKNSTGDCQRRYTINTLLRIGQQEWTIDVTLTDRGRMALPMLLGRGALKGRVLVDPARRCCQGDVLSDVDIRG